MINIIRTYDHLSEVSKRVLEKSQSRVHNKNNSNNEDIILRYLQTKEKEEYEKILDKLSDSEYYKLIKIALLSGDISNFSHRGAASITRILFNDYEEHTLVNMRVINMALLLKRFKNNEINRFIQSFCYVHNQYMRYFNVMCEELKGSEFNIKEFRKIFFDIKYVYGLEENEDLINFNDDIVYEYLKVNLSSSFLNFLLMEEKDFKENKVKMALFINYIRSIMLCMNEEDIYCLEKEFKIFLSLKRDSFQTKFIDSFFENYYADKEKYLIKSKVKM